MTRTACPSINPARRLHEHLASASPDLLRSILTTFMDALVGADVDSLCGAAHGVRSSEQANSRNGYHPPAFETKRPRHLISTAVVTATRR